MRDLSNNTLFIDSNDPNENYPFLTTKFQEALNKYALLKKVCKETMFSLWVKNLEKQVLENPHQSEWVIVLKYSKNTVSY